MSYTSLKTLTFEELLTQYRDTPLYELADGEPINMEPIGPRETLRVTLEDSLPLTLEDSAWRSSPKSFRGSFPAPP